MGKRRTRGHSKARDVDAPAAAEPGKPDDVDAMVTDGAEETTADPDAVMADAPEVAAEAAEPETVADEPAAAADKGKGEADAPAAGSAVTLVRLRPLPVGGPFVQAYVVPEATARALSEASGAKTREGYCTLTDAQWNQIVGGSSDAVSHPRTLYIRTERDAPAPISQ